MSPRTPQQLEELREARRHHIMETALKLFAVEGYSHCSISMLAREAGISKGLIYNYFESKQALLSAILEHGMQEIMDMFDPDHDGVLETLEFEAFVRKVFAAIRAHKEYWIMFISVFLQPRVKEWVTHEAFSDHMERILGMLVKYFEKRGYENPMLEMITFSSLIEGFAALEIYAYPSFEIPNEVVSQFEERIVEMYTR